MFEEKEGKNNILDIVNHLSNGRMLRQVMDGLQPEYYVLIDGEEGMATLVAKDLIEFKEKQIRREQQEMEEMYL